MSSLQVDNIQTYNSNPPVIKNASGTEVGTFCRAWVNFNGTGTVAIRASFNVSSITDNGTGDYRVNFTTAMPDANYATNVTAKQDETGTGTYVFGSFFAGSGATVANVFATTSVRVTCNIGNNTTLYDAIVMNVAIFR